MYIKNIYIIISTLLLISSCKSLPKQKRYNSTYTDVKNIYFLNGPVKITRCSSELLVNKPTTKDSIKAIHGWWGFRSKENIGLGVAYQKFNEYGFETKNHPRPNLSKDLTKKNDTTRYATGGMYLDIYEAIYDEKEILQKKKITQNHQPLKRVFNPYRVYVFKKSYTPYRRFVIKDSSLINTGFISEYKLKHKDIVQETQYFKSDENFDGILEKKRKAYTADYIYNDKKQLVAKSYNFILSPRFLDHGMSDQYKNRNYKDSPYETYAYNEQNQLTEVIHYDFHDKEKRLMLFKENYFYNANHKLSKIKRVAGYKFFGELRGYLYTELFFNDKEELTKFITYQDNDEFKNIRRYYRLEYQDHDKYNNWLTCYLYLNDGTKPIKKYSREIVYYPEEEIIKEKE